MLTVNTSCPYCEKEFKLDRMGLEDKEFIQCPHCRRIVKLEADALREKAIRVDPDITT